MKKIKFIDLFAGCGGLSDGFEKSCLYESVAHVEWEKAPCKILIQRLQEKWRQNEADKRVLRFDIQRTEDLIRGWQEDAEYGSSNGLDFFVDKSAGIDLITGGPPCQAYSLAGRIRDKNGMRYDYRNYLFESYVKIVKHYKPKAFIFENVPGMLSAKPGDIKITDRISTSFNAAGYETIGDFNHAVIEMNHYGVPQKRKRVIILGLNKEDFKNNRKNTILSFYSRILPKYKAPKKDVKSAIHDLPKLYPAKEDYRFQGRKYSHTFPQNTKDSHQPRYHNRRDIKIFYDLASDIQLGSGKYNTIEDIKKLYTERTGKTANVHKYYVLRWEEPSNTIPAHLYKDGLRHIHPDPEQARSITVREAARLQTFDDDFYFNGSQTDSYKMIGNAVPPYFSQLLANAVSEII